MIRFWERAQNGGRKSFRFEEVDLSYQIEAGHGVFVPYLEADSKRFGCQGLTEIRIEHIITSDFA